MPHGGAAQAQIAADLTAPAVLRQLWQRVVTVCLPHPGRQHALRWGWRQKRPYSPQEHAGIFLLLIVLIDGIRRCFLKFYFRFCDFFFSLDEAQYVCLFATAKRPGLQPARFQQISTLSNKIRVQLGPLTQLSRWRCRVSGQGCATRNSQWALSCTRGSGERPPA